MLKREMTVVLFLLIAFVCFSSNPDAAESGGSDAVVPVLQGTARVYSKEGPRGRGIKKGDRIREDQETRVAEKSSVEMRFPDGTVMRLSRSPWILIPRPMRTIGSCGTRRIKIDLVTA